MDLKKLNNKKETHLKINMLIVVKLYYKYQKKKNAV